MKHKLKTTWAMFWMKVWACMQAIGIYPSMDTRWHSWIVSQTGYLYVIEES